MTGSETFPITLVDSFPTERERVVDGMPKAMPLDLSVQVARALVQSIGVNVLATGVVCPSLRTRFAIAAICNVSGNGKLASTAV